MSKRARRRYKKELLKKKFQKIIRKERFFSPMSPQKEATVVGIRATTPALCSCDMCGNPRRSAWFKKECRTMPERRSDATLSLGLEEYYTEE